MTVRNNFWGKIQNQVAAVKWATSGERSRASVVFAGSSIIEFWDTDRVTNIKSVNTGIRGLTVSDLLRYHETLILSYDPSQVIIYAGDNDLQNESSPEWVVELTNRLLDCLKGKDVILLLIKPSLRRIHSLVEQRKVNTMLTNSPKSWVTCIDLDSAFCSSDEFGLPYNSLLVEDGLHLNDEGYSLLNSLVRGYVLDGN